ncbi:MAG: DUF4252 domain-containing protein [Bacteroidota bacterium]
MKTSILFVIMLIPFLTMAQETPTIKFFEKYSGEKGYTSVYITKNTFDFFANISNSEDAKSFQESVSSLNSIKVLRNDGNSNNVEDNIFHTELLPSLKKYVEILMVKEDGQFIRIFTRKVNNKITEFVVVKYGSDENILVIMEGDDINIKQLSGMSGTMNIAGVDHIDKIDIEKVK